MNVMIDPNVVVMEAEDHIQREDRVRLITEQAIQYARDLTESVRRTKEKEETLDRLRQTFFGAVNHEMQTPLALIFQMIEVLEDPRFGPVSEIQLDALTSIRRQTKNLGGMIDGLTRLATFLSKQEKVRPVLRSLTPILADALTLAEFKARSKEISIEMEMKAASDEVYLDPRQLTEALTQLLDNAIKFNQVGGSIKVTIITDATWLKISIADTGAGIDSGHIDRIWEVFEQEVDPLRRAQEGLGVGLSIAHHIVKEHGGKIEVETALGHGSIFTVKLPLLL